MRFLCSVILGLSILILETSCKPAAQEYSDSEPWAYVYAIYPFYNSESVLEVWRNEELSDAVQNNQKKSASSADNPAEYNDSTSGLRNDVYLSTHQPGNGDKDQLGNARKRLFSYRNWRNESNIRNE